ANHLVIEFATIDTLPIWCCFFFREGCSTFHRADLQFWKRSASRLKHVQSPPHRSLKSTPLLLYSTRKDMVVKKRAAVIAALSMLLLLMLSRPSHQQFSNYSCNCYRECYLGCKHAFPMLCKVVCGGSCDDKNDP
uniref:Uncharacterized protein n=2 Tax=Aegilops tauschii subsp. strangulata TaxID=200361 RepID=A0A452XCW5_AEGTS